MTKTESKTDAKPKVEIITIDPTRAAAMMQKNHEKNRRRRPGKVAEYAEDMRNGKWVLATQVIAFDRHGNLINGQHTLEAVVKSGATISCIALFGAPDAAVLVADSGMKRGTDDQFSMAGRAYPSGCGATVRRLLMGLKNFAGRSITNHRIDEFMQDHGADVAFVHSAFGKSRFGLASVRAVLCRAKIRKVPGERLERFAEVLDTGIMGGTEHGAVLLRNHIVDLKGAVANRGTERQALYALAEAALVAFLAGERVRKLVAATDEAFPIPTDKETK